jgi:murein L,D-transpeptidase YcbB/YkuD
MASYPLGVVPGAALSVLLAAGVLGASSEELNPAAPIRAFLDGNGSPRPLCDTAEGCAVWAATQAFYAGREHRPAWLDPDGRPNRAGRRLGEVLLHAPADGLDAARLAVISADAPAPEDVRATVALLRYASALGQGTRGPESIPFWRPVRRSVDLAALLGRALDDPEGALDAVRPWHPQHARLAEALARYREAAARETEGLVVPARPVLRAGQRSPLAARIRARLVLEGDLAAGDTTAAEDVYDPALAAGLRRFEARHGLTPDGRFDADLAAALSVPLEERVRQIELNLERWRWSPPAGRGRSVLVNIPTFTLHAYDDGKEALDMRVVTGQPHTPTPVFTDEMTSVVFSPYWNVPANIASSETLPAVLRDRGYLRRMGLEAVRDGRVVDPAAIGRAGWRSVGFRQRPGPGNALGLVKFLFPNPFNVYLHGTPEGHLFARARRAYSHGCIRVQKPEELARWVLDGHGGWTARTIGAAMRGGRERGVPLDEPIPLTIGYFTVWVDDDGAVRFLPDVYGHDAAQMRAF